MAGASAFETLADVEVECTHCHLRMTPHLGSGQRVKYFRCGSCHRWVSSTYAEVFQVDAKVRAHPKSDTAEGDARFAEVKDRLERWLQALDEKDPYRVLGVSPLDGMGRVRERYRELAFRSHPDRGGTTDRMRELNLAMERIVHHQERRSAVSAAVLPARASTALPARPR